MKKKANLVMTLILLSMMTVPLWAPARRTENLTAIVQTPAPMFLYVFGWIRW